MRRALINLFTVLLITTGCCAQLTLKIIEQVTLPNGIWADTVLVPFDVSRPIASLRRVDTTGEVHTVHMVYSEHPAVGLKRALGPNLVTVLTPGAMVLKVNRLRIVEIGARTFCSMHAEIITTPLSRPRRVFEASVSISERRCKDDMECHQRNILRTISAFFDLYEKAQAAGRIGSIEFGERELSESFVADTSNSPVLRRATPTRGLYRTYMDMRMNHPDTLFEFNLRETVQSMGAQQMVKMKQMSDEVVEQFWGLSTGTHPYVRIGDGFYRLDRSDHGYTTLVPQPASTDPSAVMFGGLFFGAVGAGIMGVTTSTPSPPFLFDLDMLCGDLIPHNQASETSTYSQHIFHVTRFAKNETPVTVQCYGGHARELSKMQWTSFQLAPRAEPSRVTLSNGISEVVVDIDTNSDKVYVHLIDVKRDGTITVASLKEQMRNSVINDLKAEDRR